MHNRHKFIQILVIAVLILEIVVASGCISNSYNEKEMMNNNTELLTCETGEDCALAVEKDACCVCPKLRNKEYIESNSDLDFYFRWNYTSPKDCAERMKNIQCSPCLYLDTFTCYNHTCEWLYLKDEWRTCEQDSDCIETQGGVCPCLSGGGQTGINRNHFYDWHDRLDNAGGAAICAEVISCRYGRTRCVEDRCEFVSLNKTPNITRGIYGYTTLLEGNCMPITNELKCEETHVSREIYVRNKEGVLISSIISDEDGFYEIQLPIGNYSVFIDDSGIEYCNEFSGGEIEKCPVQIEYDNNVNRYDIQIDHASH